MPQELCRCNKSRQNLLFQNRHSVVKLFTLQIQSKSPSFTTFLIWRSEDQIFQPQRQGYPMMFTFGVKLGPLDPELIFRQKYPSSIYHGT